ncbi:MAG: PAS domain S-box protein [Dehalococcoidia bacterium]|nr:PAS domain S-box protein [Dehalococcoidia bacterium]
MVLAVVLAGTATVAEAQPSELAGDIAAADRAAKTTLWLVIGLSALAFVVTAGAAALAVAVGRPLAALRASARAITSGDVKARVKASSSERMASLTRGVGEVADAPSPETEEYIAITNLTGDIIARLDKNGNWAFLNDAACQFFGKPREELLGADSRAFVHPDDLESTAQSIRETRARKALTTGFVNRQITPTGTRVVQWNGYPLFDEEGQYAGVQITGHDITERKRAEEALRTKDCAIEASIEGIALADPEGSLTYVNPSLLKMWGYDHDSEMLGKHVAEFWQAKEKAREVGRALRDRGSWVGELVAVKKDGSTFDAQLSATTVTDPAGRLTCIMGSFVDITERRRAVQALRESEEGHRELSDSITDVFFAMDRDSRYTYWNKASEKLTGISAGDAIGKSLYELFPEVKGTKADTLYQEVLRTREPRSFVNEYQIKGKNFSFEISAYPSKTGLSVFVKDITERKRAEEALRESEERYRTLFEQAPDSVLLIDGETGALVQFNDKAHETLGYTREELEKLKIPDFEAIESPEEVAKHIRRVVEEGADIFETKHRTKSGEIRDIEVRSRAVSVRGKGFNQALFHDITERKRAENLSRTQRDLGLALAATSGLEETLRLCFEAAIRVSGMDCGGVYLVDETSAELELAFHRGLSSGFVKSVSHYDADSANACLVMAGKPIYGRHQELGVPLDQAETQEGLRAIAVIPVPHDNRIIGCLNIASHTLHEVPDYARAALETVATQIGNAISRSKMEEALRESEEKYRKLVEDSIDGIMVAEGSEIGFVNQAALKMFGCQSEEEVVGRPFTDFVSAEYREMMAERGYARDRGERGPDRYEFKALRKDGSEFDAEVSISRVGYQGKVLRQAIVRDISEHKRAEEARQKAREELESRVERRMQQANDHGLTFRELTVLHLVAAGESDKEIAAVLGISPLTAHKHLANILEKMGAACRTEAGVRALREGLLD